MSIKHSDGSAVHPNGGFRNSMSFVLACVGSAVGMGNIWLFPYRLGQYGGAAFILIYILCSFVLSLPIFLSEGLIGRRTHSNAIGAMKTLAPKSIWTALGYLSVITPTVIVSYYSIVGGWAVEYFVKSFSLSFGDFIPEGWTVLAYGTVFLGISCLIVALGVRSGIEKFSKFSIPLLFVLIVVILAYSLTMPGSEKGVEYLLKPDFSKLSGKTFAFALGQSFYSLSLGMGIIITYSSYISKDENLIVSGAGTAVADLLFAILAGFAIIPAVFSAGIEPSSGPGLIFQTLPFVFGRMGEAHAWIGVVISALFFLTVTVAAMTSSVSLIEVGVAYLIEEKHLKRGWACLIVFLAVWVLGLVSVFSGKAFGLIDAFSSNFLLTVGALLAVLFVGWKMKKEDVLEEITNGGKVNSRIAPALYFLIRYIAPIAVLTIFISNFIL